MDKKFEMQNERISAEIESAQLHRNTLDSSMEALKTYISNVKAVPDTTYKAIPDEVLFHLASEKAY